MRKSYFFLLLNLVFAFSLSAQITLLETGFEGPGFDEGWTIGVSQGIDLEPEDYPETGLDPWEKWDITETTAFGYVHSGDSAAWIGGTLYDEPTHDWLMTPRITLPDNSQTVIHYWLWYHSEMTYVNRFYIMIYDFESSSWNQAYLLANDFNSPYHYIEEYKLDITEWKGKDIMIAFVKNGTYQMAMDDIRVVSYDNTSLDDISGTGYSIYPNPAKDVLNVETEIIPDNNILTISDITGRNIISITINNNNSQIDISELKNGIYFVQFADLKRKLVVR